MNNCRFQPYLSPYHDDELDAEIRSQVERHLGECAVCAAELQSLAQMSARIAEAGAGEFDEADLARLHDAVDRAAAEDVRASQVLRMAGFFSALAASVLVISGVWLREVPPASPTASISGGPSGGNVPRALAPDWERIAVNLRTEPSPSLVDDSPFSPRYAAAVHWMLNNLERKPWPKRDSL